MELTIVNKNTDFWSSISDEVLPYLLKYGYEVYVPDAVSEPTLEDYLFVIFNEGEAQSPTIDGYTLLYEVGENVGFSNVGNLAQNADDEVIGEVFDSYTDLAIFKYPNFFTYSDLADLDTTDILESDFKIQKELNFVKLLNIANNYQKNNDWSRIGY